jgi:F0F1-type ATP synthase assembly protein I
MKPETPEQSIGKGYKYLAAGLRFAGGTVLFLLAGLWLDRKLGTSPLLTLVGALLGAFLGGLSMYRELMADKANRPTWRGRGSGSGKREAGSDPE